MISAFGWRPRTPKETVVRLFGSLKAQIIQAEKLGPGFQIEDLSKAVSFPALSLMLDNMCEFEARAVYLQNTVQ